MGQRQKSLKNASHFFMGKTQLTGLFCHLFFQIIFHRTVQMYQPHNTLADHPHIPEEAFLFIPNRIPTTPTTNAPVHRDDFRIGEGKNIRRLLFEGWAQETYTAWELQRLKEFDEYAAKKGAKLDPRWDKSWRMRWLLSTGCNNKKCLADMEIFIAYQESVKELPLTKKIAQHLRNGVFYVSGRDCHYRPILVFDVEKIMESGMNEDELLETQTYFFEYVMRHLLIPGQVENWVAIIDAAHTGLFSLLSTLKRSFSFLSDTYRSRMFVCYVVRIPSSISFVWGIVKNLLEQETVRKINFFDDQTIEPLLEYCHPSQLERKFGGTLENLPNGHFWPPREVSRQYKCPKEPTRLLTRQEYTDYYNNHTFYDTKFHEENIIHAGSTELRENPNFALIKRLEKEFKIELEVYQEEAISFEKDVQPYTQIRPPLSFANLLASNKAVKSTTVQ